MGVIVNGIDDGIDVGIDGVNDVCIWGIEGRCERISGVDKVIKNNDIIIEFIEYMIKRVGVDEYVVLAVRVVCAVCVVRVICVVGVARVIRNVAFIVDFGVGRREREE